MTTRHSQLYIRWAWLIASTLASVLTLSGTSYAADTSAAAASDTYRAKVLLPDGMPAPGATVEVYYIRCDPTGDVDAPSQPTTTLTTDAQGIFSVQLAQHAGVENDETIYNLRITLGDDISTGGVYIKDGRVTAFSNIHPGPGGLDAWKLAPGCRVTGMVKDATSGKPLAGVTVVSFLSTTTAEDGAFSLGLQPQSEFPAGHGPPMFINIHKEGYAREMQQYNTYQRKNLFLTFTTEPEGIITGRVFDNQGKPIAGAVVRNNYNHVITNADGSYTLRGLDPSLFIDLQVYHVGYNDPPFPIRYMFPPDTRRGTVNISLVPYPSFPGGTPGAIIPTRTISGRVTHVDGTPAPGLSVFYGNPDLHGKTTTTDANGYYRFDHLNAYKELLTVSGAGTAPAFKYAPPGTDNAQVDLTVGPGHRLDGTVVDVSGKPIEGAHIEYYLKRNVESVTQASTTAPDPQRRENVLLLETDVHGFAPAKITDANGRFHFDDLPDGMVALDIYRDGYTDVVGRSVPTDTTQSITMKPLGVVIARVQDEDGKPITDYRLQSAPDLSKSTAEGQSAYWSLRLAGPGVGLTPSWMLGAPPPTWKLSHYPGGIFQLRDLNVDQSIRLNVWANGYESCNIDHIPVRTENDPLNVLVTFTLRRLPTLTGMVTDAVTGKGVSGARISVTDQNVQLMIRFRADNPSQTETPAANNEATLTTLTDAAGQFAMPAAIAKTVNVTITCPSYGRMVRNNIDCTKPLQVALEKAATISGKVRVDTPNDPLPRMTLSFRSGKTSDSFTIQIDRIGRDGTFRFTDLPSGNYAISEDADGTPSPSTPGYSRNLTVQAGEHVVVDDWDHPSAATLAGKITGLRLAGMTTEVMLVPCSSWGGSVEHPVKADGTFRVPVMTTGVYYCMIHQFDHNNQSTDVYYGEITLKLGVTHLDLAFTCAISGRVVDAKTGKPVAGITLTPYLFHHGCRVSPTGATIDLPWTVKPNWAPSSASTTTDEQGRFAFHHLPPGRWCLINSDQPNIAGPASAPFQLTPGKQLTDITMRIPASGTALIHVVDADTGQPIPSASVYCTDDKELFYPVKTMSPVQGGPTNGNTGGIAFDLPAGHYTAYPNGPFIAGYTVPGGYVPTPAAFDVQPGATTNVTLALHKSGSLIFRLNPDAAPGANESLLVNYHITRNGSTQPVQLSPYLEPFGGSAFLSQTRTEYPITLPPGQYDLIVGIPKTGVTTYQLAWAKKQTIEITKDKNVVVLISKPPANQ